MALVWDHESVLQGTAHGEVLRLGLVVVIMRLLVVTLGAKESSVEAHDCSIKDKGGVCGQGRGTHEMFARHLIQIHHCNVKTQFDHRMNLAHERETTGQSFDFSIFLLIELRIDVLGPC